jgi:hypothetical protein
MFCFHSDGGRFEKGSHQVGSIVFGCYFVKKKISPVEIEREFPLQAALLIIS